MQHKKAWFITRRSRRHTKQKTALNNSLLNNIQVYKTLQNHNQTYILQLNMGPNSE